MCGATGIEDIDWQMYMHYGSYLLSRSKKDKAIDAFLEAAKLGEQHHNEVAQIESYRIIGQLKDGKFSDADTISYYERCIGRGMEDEKRQATSLPYIAGLLLNKYGDTDKSDALIKDMSQLFGSDWQDRANVKMPSVDQLYYTN